MDFDWVNNEFSKESLVALLTVIKPTQTTIQYQQTKSDGIPSCTVDSIPLVIVIQMK